ncbi:TPA: hypothetical protein NU929_003363 [Vibrio cholerae]|nr:hypothetical protein [Vibrio cholerae]
MMSKLRFFTALTLVVSLNVSAFSSVVTDLKSYTYYTEQINKQVEMIEKQESLLKKADQSIKLAESTKRNLESAYRKAIRQAKNLAYDIERAKENPLDFAIKIEDSINETNSKSMQDELSKSIDQAYKFDSASPWQRNQKREEIAQQSVKKLMVLSDEARALNVYNLDELQNLIDDANAAETQKEATDVTNAILTEMLKNQLRIIDLMAAYQMTFAKLHYDNYSEEVAESRKEYTKDSFNDELTDGLKVNLDMKDSTKSLFDGLKKSMK